MEQLEKSGYSLYFSNACLRLTGTRDPDSAIVHHFTCGTCACFIPKSFLLGGVNLCQKSKWVVFDVFSFSFFFFNIPPSPFCFLVVMLYFNNASFTSSRSSFGIHGSINTCLILLIPGVKLLSYCSMYPTVFYFCRKVAISW